MKSTIKCVGCNNFLDILYNDFLYPHVEYRGLVCDNVKCKYYGIDRRHPNQYETLSMIDKKHYMSITKEDRRKANRQLISLILGMILFVVIAILITYNLNTFSIVVKP